MPPPFSLEQPFRVMVKREIEKIMKRVDLTIVKLKAETEGKRDDLTEVKAPEPVKARLAFSALSLSRPSRL